MLSCMAVLVRECFYGLAACDGQIHQRADCWTEQTRFRRRDLDAQHIGIVPLDGHRPGHLGGLELAKEGNVQRKQKHR